VTEVLQHTTTTGMDIDLSPAAKRHIISYLTTQGQKGIRLSVKKTGCSGLSYVIDYVEKADAKDMVFPFEDAYIICVDKASYPYLKGMKMDYVKQGLNYKFVFINPNQTGQCGCGESFTVD
jgi:iron-sulfur cluster assembly accessory protein